MKNFDKLIQTLRDVNNFIISTHVNPDGDGIGSALGMAWILQKLGKKYAIVLDDNVPNEFEYLTGVDHITSYIESYAPPFIPETAIIVDSPNKDRIGKVSKLVQGCNVVINIDHHVSNDMFGDINITDFDASASAEIIYIISKNLNLEPDRDFAEQIYTGIVIDTGRFSFSNTSPRALQIAADLIEAGARPDFVSERLYSTNTIETLQAICEVLSSLKVHIDGKFAISSFSHNFLTSINKANMKTEGLANYPLSVEGVEVAALLQEPEPGVIRGSLRSKVTHVDVNELANSFNGGGHARAAGFRTKGSIQSVESNLIKQLQKVLE